MADATLISASTLSISPAVSLTQTDISASCCDGYLVDAPSNDRSLKEELRSGSCIDSINWVPPEPEDHQEDDVDDLRCREEGWSWSSRFETEMSKKQFEAIYLYFKREIEYYLKSVGISCSGNDRDVWADIVTMLSMEAALRMPEYSFRGNSGDPNVYVKVKCIATGSCKQSGVFKGLVFNKHAAHEDVPTEYKNPLLLLVRDVSSDQLSVKLLASIISVIPFNTNYAQDKKRENCLKEMIKLCNPNVILVEKTLSPDIQEILHAKRMTLVMELKQHHRRKIALCTRRADFFSSKLRQCHSLYFINIVEEHAPLCADGKRPTKRLMFLRGTRGVTILLKGSHIDELKKIKRVVKLAVFKIYHYTRDILASSRTGRMIISKCNTDFMKHKDDITAVLGLARYSVLISRCNAKKGNACLSDINLYRNFDMPLQMFMCEDLFNQELLCGTCNELPEAHISYYVHRHKKITVKVNRLPFDKYLPGENEGKLWMWSFCGQCKPPNESLKRVLVPVAARSVSFGMILDHALSKNYLWDIPLHCEHFFYGDYLHFYGLGSMVVMFKCSSVPTYSVSLPPTKIKPCGSFEGDLLNDQKNSSDHEDGFSSWIANVLAILKDQKKSLDDPNEDVKPYQYVQKMFTLSSPKLWCFNFGNSHDSKGNLHPEISLGRYSVACLFHNEFVELRSQCGLSEPDYISSLSRSTPWDAKGGKSKSFFAKTLDDRFIIKEIKKVEFCAFHEFALVYFAHMKDCFKKRQNSLLAKTLGVYKLTKKKSGKKYDVIVMENITYGRKITRLYDLKGALYGRFNPATNGEGNVLWDQNFLDDMKHSLFEVDTIGVWELQHPIRNDTSFLESRNVMDYSLLVGVDTEKKEIVCGIIDYLRRYTLEKLLESWFKSNFIVPKNHLPTVLPSQQYTNRFIKFILDSISDPLVSKRLLEEYKKVVHEQPTAAMSSTSILNGGEIWKKTFEAHLQSPYKNRIVDVKKRANEDEEIICEWLFSSKGGKRDEVFRTKNGQVTTRKVMKTLHPECYIGANVLDSWVELLNHEEQLRSNYSKSRLFCKTSMTTSYMEDQTINHDRRLHLFIENFFDSVGDDEDKRTLKGIDLVFFPVVRNDHIYVLVFNLEDQIINIIDNNCYDYHVSPDNNTDDYITYKYGILPNNLHLMLFKYMWYVNHPKTEAMCAPYMVPDVLPIPWWTRDNYVDSGIYTMRHMETYTGELAGWECGLPDKSQLRVCECLPIDPRAPLMIQRCNVFQKSFARSLLLLEMRYKYAAKLLLCDLNMHRDKIVNEANHFQLMKSCGDG